MDFTHWADCLYHWARFCYLVLPLWFSFWIPLQLSTQQVELLLVSQRGNTPCITPLLVSHDSLYHTLSLSRDGYPLVCHCWLFAWGRCMCCTSATARKLQKSREQCYIETEDTNICVTYPGKNCLGSFDSCGMRCFCFLGDVHICYSSCHSVKFWIIVTYSCQWIHMCWSVSILYLQMHNMHTRHITYIYTHRYRIHACIHVFVHEHDLIFSLPRGLAHTRHFQIDGIKELRLTAGTSCKTRSERS